MRSMLAAGLAALVAAAGASAAGGPPSAAGSARLGTLTVTSGILVSATSADLRGVWQDTRVRCTVSRRLTVQVDVFYRSGATSSHRRRMGTFSDANCAEGGPNVGFTLAARSLGYACPNGRWKPGLIDFVVRTTEPTRRLRATASLTWANTTRC
jgi:hypothetical protein